MCYTNSVHWSSISHQRLDGSWKLMPERPKPDAALEDGGGRKQ
jgi:hypothetical protein